MRLWEQMAPRCGGRIYVMNHNALLHRSCRLPGFREDFLKVNPHYTESLWKLLTFRVWPFWTQRGMDGMIYVGDSLHCYKLSIKGYRKDFFQISHYKSMRAIDPQGYGKFASKRLAYVGYH